MSYVREALLALILLAAAGLVVYGIAGWSREAACIVAGILLAGLGVLFLSEADS